jgi:hypothetical protein
MSKELYGCLLIVSIDGLKEIFCLYIKGYNRVKYYNKVCDFFRYCIHTLSVGEWLYETLPLLRGHLIRALLVWVTPVTIYTHLIGCNKCTVGKKVQNCA